MKQLYPTRFRLAPLQAAVLIAILLFGGMGLSVAEATVDGDNVPRYRKVAVIEFHGPITHRLETYFQSRLARAKAAGADLVILDIDSPGGLLEQSLLMANSLSQLEWADTVAWVSREAISGAALVALGCDQILIREDGLFGDIGAIHLENGAFQYIPAKLNSYLVQEAAKLARAKGRPPELVEAMIDKDVLVYRNPTDGQFRTVRVSSQDRPPAPWELITESGEERFLTVSGTRAKELGVANGIVTDPIALAERVGYDPQSVTEYEYRTADTIVYVLNHPFITGLLVVIGVLALLFELSAPGIGVGGLISGLCAALFFWSRFMGGTSGWLEVVLFLAGLTFLAFELFVIPGFGISGLLGLFLLVGSVVMASQDFVVPQTSGQLNQVVTTLLMLLCSGAVVGVAAIFLAKRFGQMPMFNRLILAPSPPTSTLDSARGDGKGVGKPIPQVHPDISVGDWGVAESLLRPAGRARFHRKSFDVVSDGSFILPEQPVKVVDIRGNRIVVAEVEDLLAETTYQPPQEGESASRPPGTSDPKGQNS